MAAALEAGVTRLFRIGGAHAIAALAYGTRDGAARRQDRRTRQPLRRRGQGAASPRDCAIDFYAGPTEIVVVAGGGRAGLDRRRSRRAGRTRSRRAVDLHHLESRRSPSRVAQAVDAAARPRSIVRRSLAAHGVVVVAAIADEAMALANRLAPEHLVVDRESLIERPLTAGAVFVGPFTAQAAGDYATGSNHVLPTSGAARFRGGLSAADFVRVMSVQRVTRAGLARLAPTILPLARAEGLDGARRVDRDAAATIDRLEPSAMQPSAMSHYQKPPELYDGLRLHQNENTGGCSPRVHRGAGAAARRIRSASIRRTPQPRDARARDISASRPTASRSSNGLDEGIMALAVGVSAAVGRRTRARSDRARSRPSRSSASTPAVAGGRARAGDAAARLRFPLDEVLAAITPRRRGSCS